MTKVHATRFKNNILNIKKNVQTHHVLYIFYDIDLLDLVIIFFTIIQMPSFKRKFKVQTIEEVTLTFFRLPLTIMVDSKLRPGSKQLVG